MQNQQVLIGTTDNSCEEGVQPSGALYKIIVPETWNHDVVLFAHGYQNPYDPGLKIIDYPVGNTTVSQIITGLGYAFANTSFRENGLVVPDAVDDLLELAEIFKTCHPDVRYVYLAGVSEGGLITTLAIENHPDIFNGSFAGCGAIGNFSKQLDYLGDFRIIFDYFFADLLGSTWIKWSQAYNNGAIPLSMISNWQSNISLIIKPCLSQ